MRFALGCLLGVWLGWCLAGPVVHAQRLPDTTEQRVEAGPPLSAEDSKLFGLFERFADAREQRIANELVAHADGKKNQVVAGSILAGAIAYAIKAIVTAIVTTILISILIALFWKYGLFIALGYVVTVLLPAWFAGSWAGRKAAK